jgi:2,4-diaminopentanoate dehydrogenase
MTFRVAHIATGNVGRLALAGVMTNPQLELCGLYVSSPDKVGRDAGELAGLDMRTGIVATDDMDAALAGGPHCAVYCAMGDNRMGRAMKDLCGILGRGINVAGSSPVPLQYPWNVLPDKYIEPVAHAAQAGNASVFITGVDPGFINDLLPLVFSGTCQHIEQVRCTEIADYATYDGATVLFDVMGFGTPADVTPMQLQPGLLAASWGCSIHQLAAGLGIDIDEVTEHYERDYATEAFDITAGRIPQGGQQALRFEIRGMAAGRAAIVVEHVTRLREDIRPDWPQPAQPGGSYRVELAGEPSYRIDICPTSRKGDHNHAAIVAAAARIVNSVPAVVAADPGVLSTLDLPLITGAGLYQPLTF